MTDLTSAHSVVMGGVSGIGAAVAQALAGAGAHVARVGRDRRLDLRAEVPVDLDEPGRPVGVEP